MKRRALVTGGTGYLGSALTDRLVADGWTPVLLVRSMPGDARTGVEHLLIDAARAGDHEYRNVQFDAAFHLAAAPPGAPLADHLDATLGTGDLLQQLIVDTDSAANVVVAGSYWQDAVGPFGVGPLNGYAAAKQAFRALAASRAAHDGVPHVMLHIGDVYGPGDTRPKFLPEVLDGVRHNVRISATSGEQLVSYVHRDDVVTALLVAASSTISGRPPLAEYTVAGPRFEPLRDVFVEVERAVSTGLPIDWGARESRARAVKQVDGPPMLPDWAPSRSLSEFVEEEVASWVQHRVS